MKAWQYVSLVVIAIAVAGLIGYALKGFFERPDAYLWWKVLVGICIVGFVSLLAYVAAERLRGKKKEPEDIRKVKH